MSVARISVGFVMLSLAACAVGPDFRRPAPPTAADYGAAPMRGELPARGAEGDTVQRLVADMDIPGQWWTLFESPRLNRLVAQALEGNPDVAAARAGLRQAHELSLAERTAYVPTVQGNFAGARAKNALGTISNPTSLPQSDPYYTLYTAQLSLSYTPDLFGATRRAVELSRSQEAAARFELEATYLTLSSNVVVTAVQEASLRGQIEATERSLALQHDLTLKVEGQRALGTASDLDVLAQRSLEAQTAQTLPPLQRQLGQTRDALTALLGGLPSEEPVDIFHLEDFTLPSDLPVSLPSKLVVQRPDVRAAEENLHAASAADGVALAQMLPQFTIDGNLGSTALTVGGLLSPYTGFWTVGASLSQTLFDAGALLHRKRAADAALDQAAAQYRGAVILACQNVADTLRALRADADALSASADAERAARKTFELARQQRQLGTVALIAVMNAELGYRQAQVARVEAEANRLADTAGLFQALGGGWWNRREEVVHERAGPKGE